MPAGDEDVFRLIVENAIDLIVHVDSARKRVYVSPSSREILGFPPSEMIGKHIFDLVHPDDLPVARTISATIGPLQPKQHLTFRMRRADGHYIWVGATYRYVPADGGMLAVLRDITTQKLAEQGLAEANERLEAANAILHDLANIDGLTGLANRRRFDEVLDAEFDRARRQDLPLGLVLFDVDHFKAFNDRYGHLTGDDCLRRVSRCIGEGIRRSGDLAARYGGEEIAMLLPATDADGSARTAVQICGAVAGLQIAHAESSFGIVTVSAGVAAINPVNSNVDPATLIRAADVALYQAKANGRNCVRTFSDTTILTPGQ